MKNKKKHKGDSDLKLIFENLQTKVDAKQAPFDPQEHKDTIRGNIAMIFTCCFFGLIGLILILYPIYNYLWAGSVDSALNIKDTLLLVSSVVSGPFGFVIGYYFKGSESNQDA